MSFLYGSAIDLKVSWIPFLNFNTTVLIYKFNLYVHGVLTTGHDMTQANNNVEAAAYFSLLNRSYFRLTDFLFFPMIQNHALQCLPTKLGFQKII